MHYLYILYSKAKDNYYIGETTNVKTRCEMHNKHSFKKAYTKIADDWTVSMKFLCNSRQDALYLERFIKKMKSKKFTKKVIDNPTILSDILSKKH